MPEVTIGSQTYFSYVTVEDADDWMNGQIGADADAWRAADQDTKARGLITGTREIDRQQWQGEKTDPDQPGDFPRTGLFYRDGSAVDPATIPPEVEQATILLAAIAIAGTAAQNAETIASGTRRLKAGSVEIEYFRAIPGPFGTAPFAKVIMDLIGQWLAGFGTGVGGPKSWGVCGKSAFNPPQYKPSDGF